MTSHLFPLFSPPFLHTALLLLYAHLIHATNQTANISPPYNTATLPPSLSLLSLSHQPFSCLKMRVVIH